MFVDGVVYAANDASGLAAVRADGTGDVTKTHVQWTTDIDVPDVCSPLVTDKYVLLLAHGLLAGFDAKPAEAGAGRTEVEEREPLWEEDLQEEVSSSPSQVGNLRVPVLGRGQGLDCRAAGGRLQTRRRIRDGRAGAIQPGVPAGPDLHPRAGPPVLHRREVNDVNTSM